MRAICIREFGGPEKLELLDIPQPVLKQGYALIKVKTAALNHLDIWVRKGRPGLTLKEPHVMGSDAAGIVEKIGPGCETMVLKAGDEVVVNPGISCMQCEYCMRGMHSECPSFRIVGFQHPGIYSEFAAVPAVNLFPKPSILSWEEAAALPLSYLTAWRMLFTRSNLQGGESLLIHGIGGGVAVAALQFARCHGASVIVTSSSDAKLARAREMGALHGINYRTTPDVGAAVRAFTNGRGVDVVLDSTGAATLAHSMAAVRRGGRIVTCGVTGGAEANLNLQQLYWNHISLLGSTMGSMEDMRRMLCAVESSGIKPRIDETYALEEIQKAVLRMETGAQMGKIVLRIS